jgi:hypothetical protein
MRPFEVGDGFFVPRFRLLFMGTIYRAPLDKGCPTLLMSRNTRKLKDGKVKLDGGKVVEFPKPAGIPASHAEVLRWSEGDKRLIIKAHGVN